MTAISTQAHICPEKKKKLGVGQIILIIVMMLFVLICTLPFINVIAMSMSSKSAILRGAVSFWPVESTSMPTSSSSATIRCGTACSIPSN